ncbi:MFS transporter [Amycolatopsis sp. Poz14]|uniref:MFS transporter n=1 Tax=Amycolatopsis sp. Poz14 TaxID=1447705 RepID=UPI001EE88D7E|nr:MFS transporter [Amycolatopsis sp. Poz14]
MTTELSSSTRAEPLPLVQAWLVLAVVVIADLMDLIDTSVAALAGPSIRADLGGGPMTLQWVLSAYTAAFALGLVTSGRLGDLLGRRRLFLLGMTGFTLASLACGLAPGPGFLIGARVLQGLFGAAMIPQGIALVKVVFPPDQLRKALMPFGPIMGMATVAGPILSGWLLHLNLFGSEWRSIFLINVPFGILAGLLALRVLPRHSGEDRGARLDLRGVGLLTAASALLIVPLIQGRELGWPAWTYVLMAAGVVAFVLFARSERRSSHPVIAPSLFAKRGFVFGLLITGGFYASLSGFVLVVNLLLQSGLGWTPLQSGFALLPWAAGTAIATLLSGAVLAAKLGRVPPLRTGHRGCRLARPVVVDRALGRRHHHLAARPRPLRHRRRFRAVVHPALRFHPRRRDARRSRQRFRNAQRRPAIRRSHRCRRARHGLLRPRRTCRRTVLDPCRGTGFRPLRRSLPRGAGPRRIPPETHRPLKRATQCRKPP